MTDYELQQKVDNKIKKYQERMIEKVGAMLWAEEYKLIHNMRRKIDKSERSLNITNKNIIKKLDVFCLKLGNIGFYIDGNTRLYDDGEVSSRYLESFNEKQKSNYGGFEIKSYSKIDNFKSIEENYYHNIYLLKHAMEKYIMAMNELRRDHRNLKRFLKIFDNLTTYAINKMSKEELISYFKRRKMKISV